MFYIFTKKTNIFCICCNNFQFKKYIILFTLKQPTCNFSVNTEIGVEWDNDIHKVYYSLIYFEYKVYIYCENNIILFG